MSNASVLLRTMIDAVLPERLRSSAGARAPTPADRRMAPRRQTALTAEIFTGGRCYPGQIRDISTSGLRLAFETAPPLFKRAQLVVRAGTLAPFTGAVRWIAGRECGLAFNTPLAKEVAEDAAALFDPGKRVRPSRANVLLPVRVRGPGVDCRGTIENISSGGARIATDLPLAIGIGVMIDMDDMLPIGAHVRWSEAGRCGVMFNKLLPVAMGEEISRRCSVYPSWLDELREAHALVAH